MSTLVVIDRSVDRRRSSGEVMSPGNDAVQRHTCYQRSSAEPQSSLRDEFGGAQSSKSL
jgi:hypothetical protein